ncbi:MAG TPA: hypothetical protein VNA13_03620 [Xanthomonadales bacterium]|nr:hypothetical protein [Xanthomonadales bacterium]
MKFIFLTILTFVFSFLGMLLIFKPASNPLPADTSKNVKTSEIPTRQAQVNAVSKKWNVQSVDTMKQSRDQARQFSTDINLQKTIDPQVSAIAGMGATHIGIGTPYDPEFLPVLKLWVQSARKHNLKVFFRGNLSGWEKWFGYQKIGRAEHIRKTEEFIEKNPGLFEDGDIFSSCPECENGEKLDRSNKAQIDDYKAFLIKEYNITKKSFKKINKQVASNYYSMNGDMAFLMMDKKTTAAFDGIVVIDHYVKDTTRLEKDIKELARKSGGKIVLGEFGAPIPNIHGRMSDEEQKRWIEDALNKVSKIPELYGINYWVNIGGSTAIFRDNLQPKPVVSVITAFFSGNK